MAKLKIASKTRIKNCNIKSGARDIVFEGFKLTPSQCREVATLIDEKDEVLVTITLVQEKLPIEK